MAPTIAAEAHRILIHHLQENNHLNLPPSVSTRLDSVTFTPSSVTPSIPTPAKISESCSALWALLGAFSATISEQRYLLTKQEVTVDVHSATLYPMSALITTIDNKGIWESSVKERVLYLDLGQIREPYRSLASNIYKTKDNLFFHLHGSLNATNTLHMLGLPQHRPDLTSTESIKEVYRTAVAQHTASWLDIEANSFWRQPGAICYTKDEFRRTAHGRESWNEALYSLSAESDIHLPPTPWPTIPDTRNRPLAGIKVLDVTRVIAGPSISKILALLGADVLRVSCRKIPEATVLMFDTQVGKRDVEIDLKSVQGKLEFRALLEDADVLLDGFRPGVMDRLGFGREMVHEIGRRRGRGIVYARENTYGWRGEWKDRCGYQQISDCVTGVSWAQGLFLGLDEPVVPLLPNSDYQTGIVGAIGITHALYRRAEEGGSYNVDTSLNQFNNWYLDLGLHGEEATAAIEARDPEFKVLRHDTDLFTLAGMTKQSLHKSHGSGKGELFDPARFTAVEMRWGREGEKAEILDWTKIVRFSGQKEDNLQYGYDHGSHMPGADQPEWMHP